MLIPLSISGLALDSFAQPASAPSSKEAASPHARYAIAPGYRTLPLPDKGPRYPTPIKGEGADLFITALDAYQRRDIKAATDALTIFTQQFKASPYMPAAKSLQAEATLLDSQKPNRSQKAIDIYRTVLTDYPDSANAARARWRLGDLYGRQNFFVEAQSTYERGLADSASTFDSNRCLLGLSVLYVFAQQWKDAEQAFTLLSRRATDEALVQHAALGLADVLYMENRLGEAKPLYEAAWRKWPGHMRMRPASLLAFADTLMASRQEAAARDLFITFYNLHPDEPVAPGALVRVGDSFRRTGNFERAAMFYARTIRDHAGVESAGRARMRLAQLGQEILSQSAGTPPAWVSEAAVQNALAPDVEPAAIQQTLRTIAAEHADSELGSEALYHLGEHLQWADDLAAGIQAYEDLVRRAGKVADDPWPTKGADRLAGILRPWIASALESNDDWTALTLFHRLGPSAEDAFPGTTLQLRLAHLHQKMKFSAEAVNLYQALLRGQPSRDDAQEGLIGLGRAYLDQGDHTAARRTFERYRVQYPLGRWKDDAMRWLAVALELEGKPARVIRTSEKWLTQNPKHPDRPEMLLLLGRTYEKTGQKGQAVRIYEQAARAGGLNDTQSLLRYADLLIGAKRAREAAIWYRRALRSQPSPTEAEWARVGLVTALFARKQYGESRKVLNELDLVADDRTLKAFSGAMDNELTRAGAPPRKDAKTKGRGS